MSLDSAWHEGMLVLQTGIMLFHMLQVASISTDIQQQLGKAVQAALSESLPKELAGPQLKAALEGSLHSQLQQSLAKPLQDSFTAAFHHQLMPAFEGACRDMFAQVSYMQPYMLAQISHIQSHTMPEFGIVDALRCFTIAVSVLCGLLLHCEDVEVAVPACLLNANCCSLVQSTVSELCPYCSLSMSHSNPPSC